MAKYNGLKMTEKIIFHKHHIIPLHIGGTNDPSNLLSVNVPLHAFLHKLLWEEHGRWQDKLAWQTLSGQIGKEEAIRITQSMGGKMSIDKIAGWNKGIPCSEDVKLKISKSMKGRPKSESFKQMVRESNSRRVLSDETKRKMGAKNIGRIPSEEEREKMRQAWKKRKAKNEQV